MPKSAGTPELRRLNSKASQKYNRFFNRQLLNSLDIEAIHMCLSASYVSDDYVRTRWKLYVQGQKKCSYAEIDISNSDYESLKDLKEEKLGYTD